MKMNKIYQKMRQNLTALVSAGCLWALLAVPAQGGVIFAVNPGNQAVTAGSVNNFFDVVLQNNDNSALSVAGFSFLVSTLSSDLVFTGATTAATNYIFAGDSFVNDFASGDLLTEPPGSSLVGSDITSSGNDILVAANSIVGLGRVFFSIGGGATPGIININIGTGPSSSLSNALAFTYTLGSPIDGTVTVGGPGNEVPEPGTAALFLLAIPAVAYLRKRQ